MKKILVVGGVAGGASFCARMRRLDEHAQIIMFEKGQYISFANCGLPYHIGEVIKDHDDLIIQTPQSFSSRFNIDIRIRSEVKAIDTEKRIVTVLHDGSIYEESYDYIVLSPGAEPLKPPIKGIDNKKILSLRNIPDMDRIKLLVDNNSIKHAAVIGGGFIGLEMAENLRNRNIEVTQIELSDQVFTPADPEMAYFIHQHLKENGVELLLNDGADSFRENESGIIEIELKSGKIVKVDLVILAIGVKPDTDFIKNSGIKLNERGAIVVDNHLRTNISEIYAVGDAIEVTDFISGNKVMVPLAGPANRQARIAADNIAGFDSVYKNTQGTAICKIFDLTAAVTGLNEKMAKRAEIDYLKSYTHSANHATYYPGSSQLSVKILFSPTTGKLLGAQIIGKEGVDKRIDVLAAALRHGLTVTDLSELELSYAPPYGSAKDAINTAGFTSDNILKGIMPVWYSENFQENRSKCTIMDVRTEEEFTMGHLENARNIPLDQLRKRIGEIDKERPVLVYCQVGLRGHIATRILLQNGFKTRNLSGGYKTYRAYLTNSGTDTILRIPANSPNSQQSNETKMVIDACGLQCPGPIMKLKKAIDEVVEDDVIEIRATEMGFAADIPAWCTSTGNTLLSMRSENGTYIACVKKGNSKQINKFTVNNSNSKTMVIFSNDFDKMMAAFIIANGAASTGSEVTMFFTFWGLNLLRKESNIKVEKNIIEKMFGFMMPRGAKKLVLSKMHMGGMGTMMIRKIMKNKNVFSLSELMEAAQNNKVRFVACSMSMDIMGIKREELIDGVEIGGVASYLEKADSAGYNLFI